MDILERYLQAIRKYLPRQRQDDILEELSVDIQSQIEDMEAGLNRPLTAEEREALIKHYGHPMVVASRYQPQRTLIGAGMFPYYWFVLTRALGLAGILYVVANSAFWLSGNVSGAETFRQILRFPSVALQVAAWITLAFALLDWGFRQYDVVGSCFRDWEPSKLPAVEKQSERRKRWNEIFELLFMGIAAVWWLAVPHAPVLMLGPVAGQVQAMPFALAPGWHLMYWVVTTSLIVQVIYRAVALRNSPSRVTRQAMELVFKVVGLGILGMLLRMQEWVVPVAGRTQVNLTAAQLNYGVHIGLQLMSIIVVLDLFWEAWKLAVLLVRGETGRSGGQKLACWL